jgi:hypothetical protein
MILVPPSAQYKDSYIAALKEFKEEGRHEGDNLEKARTDLDGFVEFLKGQAEGRSLKEGYPPSSNRAPADARRPHWLRDSAVQKENGLWQKDPGAGFAGSTQSWGTKSVGDLR